MKLTDLIGTVAAAGEQASQACRIEYLRDLEALHGEPPAKIPGSPPLATVVPLETLGPKRLKLTTQVTLSEQDGTVEATFTAATRHWWDRAPRNVSTVEIEWDRREAPEGVCRVRDKQNAAQDKVVIDV